MTVISKVEKPGRLVIKKKPSSKLGKFWAKNKTGYLFLSPFLILLIIFVIAPVFISFGLSLFNYNMLQPPKWLGLDNFKLLFMDDDVFLIALKNTFIFALFIGPIGYAMSFLMAWILDSLRFKNAFALAFYVPSITSGVAMTVVWQYFFNNDRYGLVNNMLLSIGAIFEPILWNQHPTFILPVVVLISIWMSMGTGFLVFLAGLQSMPTELYEQGKIDGIANKFQELFYITLPLMKPQLLFGAITSIVNSFGVFDIAMQFAGFPSPNYAAHTIVAHLYDYAFVRFQMGYAAAIAVTLFAITFTLGQVCVRLFRSDD